MGWQKKIALAVLFGATNAALFYVVGGVAAPYVAGVSAGAYAAIGFLTAASVTLLKDAQADDAAKK